MSNQNKALMQAAIAAVAVVYFASGAQAAILINEMLINAPGGDDGQEFVELISDTGGVESLDGMSIVTIEGDASGAGQIDRFFTFDNTHSTGTNGLFLLRDTSKVLDPAPDAGTTVLVEPATQTLFTNDIENGTQTFALVTGFTGSIGDDLDTDNNGTVDVALPWTTTIQAFAWTDGDGTDFMYGAAIGGFDVPDSGFTPDAYVAGSDYFMDVLDDDADMNADGPYFLDPDDFVLADGSAPPGVNSAFTLTPGSANTSPIPEPSAVLLALLSVCLSGVAVLRARGG